jgi:LacI family transcriptional regulator
MKKKSSLKDIAEKVGVSAALVSYVLNNLEKEKRVGKEVALRIRKAAKELNYTTNQIAKSLKTRRTNTIGLIVADINYRFTTGVTKAIEAECQKHNLTVIYGSSGENKSKFAELIRVLVDRQVDGLIIVPVEQSAKEIDYLNKHEIPFVLIDRILPGVKANLIAVDNTEAAHRATNHLIRTGHTRIGFISYHSHLINLQDRKKGFLSALKEAGQKQDRRLIQEISDRNISDEVKHSVDRLLSFSPAADSIFFATDTLAVEGLRHINALKIKVPEKLGIVSFDESEAFDLFYCPITHGRQPLNEIGRMAVTTLLEVMKHSKTRKKVLLKSEFVIGKSCGEK